MAAGSAEGGAPVRHRIELAAVRVVRAIVRPFPMSWARAWGSALGRLVYRFDRRHRRIALDNLEAAFPGRPEDERRAIARGVFSHLGRLFLEVMKIDGMPSDALLSLIDSE